MMDLWIREVSSWRWWGWWIRMDKTPCVTREVLDVEMVLGSKMEDRVEASSKDRLF
jgi:hypothetical protein